MATSGTVAFRPDIEEIITEAYERCGVDPQILTGYHAVRARRSLNLMFADWSTRGINYWTTAEQTLALTQSTRSYVLPEGTVDIIHAVTRRSNADVVLARSSLSDYNAQANKTAEGRPTNFFLDRQYTPQIYLWPVPENSTDTIVYWALNQVEDVTASNQDADIPNRWTEAMCAGLAVRLYTKMPEWNTDRLTELKNQYTEAFDHASTDEGDRATLKIVPTSVI